MATIFFNAPSMAGETGLVINFYDLTTGARINSTGDLPATESANGTFSVELTDPITDNMRVDLIYQGDVTHSDILYFGETLVGKLPTSVTQLTVASSAQFYTTVRRSNDDDTPIYFEWTSQTALSCEISIDGGAYVATTSPPVYVRQDGLSYVYSVLPNGEDRPPKGSYVIKVTDTLTTRYIPCTVDSGVGNGGGLYQLTVTVTDNTSQAVQGARVSVDGTTLVVTTGTDGSAVVNLDDGSYIINISSPAGYNDPSPQPVTIAGADSTLNVTVTPSGGGISCEIPPL